MSVQPSSDWLISFLVDSLGVVFPHDPFCIGVFELSRKPEPFEECESALAVSAQSQSISIDDRIFRMRTFFVKATEGDAIRLGRLYAREALILLGRTLPFGGVPTLLRAGCLFNLSENVAKPILLSPREQMRRTGGMQAILDEVAHHPSITINSLLSTSPPTYGELGSAVRRSAHWSHLATLADDYGERLLLHWMAAETLTRVDENESLTPKLMAAAGLPSSRYEMSLPLAERDALWKVKAYLPWRKRLNSLCEQLREARNKIAHAGFREVDLSGHFSNDDQLVLRRFLPRVVGELQGMALNALQLGIFSVRSMWERFGECFLLHRQITLARHLEGNLLFSLAEPEDPFDE